MRARDYSKLDSTVFTRRQLSALRVMVVGAGALGNEVIKNLILRGIGLLYIVDRDTISPSNLTRSVLFCVPEIADVLESRMPKAEFVAQRIRQINPDVEAIPIVAEIADVGLGMLTNVDLA